MKNALVSSILALTLCLSLGVNIYQYKQANGLHQELAQVQESGSGLGSEAGARSPSLLAAGKNGADETEATTPDSDGKTESATPAVAEAPATTGMPAGQDMREMMKNPAMKEMVHAQQKAMVDTNFEDLFAFLELDDEETAHLSDLLVRKQIGSLDSALELMDGSTSEERKKELKEFLKDEKNKVNEDIKTFLNDEDDYATYEQYNKTLHERMQTRSLRKALEETETPLSPEQESQLVESMHEERAAFKFKNDYTDQENADPSSMTPENVNTFIEQSSQLDSKVRERAAEILTEDQLPAFETAQKQLRSMQEMGLRMASQMFGQRKKTPAADATAE